MAGAPYRVFISHTGPDSGVASLLSGSVERVGAQYILDKQHMTGGADFYDWMCASIRGCREFLLLLSPDALKSQYVTFELGLAEAHGLWIVPMLHRMDVRALQKSGLGQGLLAKRSVLTLEQHETYQSQLKDRMLAHADTLPSHTTLSEMFDRGRR